MQFLLLVRRSIYDPSFYRSIPQRPFSFTLRYFFTLTVGVAVAASVLVSLRAVPVLRDTLLELGKSFVVAVPQDFTVTIEDGVAQANSATPAVVPFPRALAHSISASSSLQYFLVMDPSTPFQQEKFFRLHTLLWLARDAVGVYDGPSAVKVLPFSREMGKVVLDAAAREKVYIAIQRFIRFLPLVVALFTFFAVGLTLAWTLVYYLIAALLVWGFARLRRVRLRYRDAYLVAVHAGTLGFILYGLSFGGLARVPFLYTFLLLVVVLLNMPAAPRGTQHFSGQRGKGYA